MKWHINNRCYKKEKVKSRSVTKGSDEISNVY